MFNTPQFCASNSGASASKPLWKVGSFSRMSGSTPFARSWWSSGEWTAPRQKNIVDEQPPKGIGSSKYIYWLVVHLQKVDSLLSLTGRYSPSFDPILLVYIDTARGVTQPHSHATSVLMVLKSNPWTDWDNTKMHNNFLWNVADETLSYTLWQFTSSV